MAYDIGYVDNTGSEGLAHWQMLLKLKTFAEANGWTTLRYLNPTDGSNRELIMKGVGLSGTEEIYIGFRSYHLVSANYYNLSMAGFTGYVAANAFVNQPGYQEFGVCAHNTRIDYWLTVNAQRVLLAMKVGSPSVYEVGYTGKFFPYATPKQYPYPLAVLGTLAGTPATRYDATGAAHSCGAKGSPTVSASLPNAGNGALRDTMGAWKNFFCLPWTVDMNGSAAIRRDTGGYYSAMKAVLLTDSWYGTTGAQGSAMGELDGLRYVSGFNNGSENTATIDGKVNVVIGDCYRTGIGDYFLLEMS